MGKTKEAGEGFAVIRERIEALRARMREAGLFAYVVPTADYHESEYVGEHFKVRAYLSGFTGSAGTLAVTQEEACLWTDGRYFIQAAAQLEGSGIRLMRMGQEGVPSLEAYLVQAIPRDGRLGFDGRVVSAAMGEELRRRLAPGGVGVEDAGDLADALWPDRPAIPTEKAFLLDVWYAGVPADAKLAWLRGEMKRLGSTVHILTTLADIAWLFNVRGNDIPFNPFVLSYAVIEEQAAYLFVDAAKVEGDVRRELEGIGVTILPYGSVYEFVRRYGEGTNVLLCKSKVNFAITSRLSERVRVIDAMNPTLYKKAIKNETEIENLRRSHVKDGVAFTKFMYWLKQNVGKMPMSERSAAEYLEERRREQEGYIEPSFATISAYREHAAMMHYSATEASDAQLLPEGMLLVDSGGQYFEGTTDITRTMALGPITEEEKKHFCAVLRAVLRLQSARFLHGCNGQNLDILARGILWDLDIDYQCGTGHGVGYLSGVHEAPNGIRWKRVQERYDSGVLEAGMVTTDEPGVYLEGRYGIRTENELVCRQGVKNEYGQFLYFETITAAPIDLDAVDTKYLQPEDVERLNAYHAWVYETLSPFMTASEDAWLRHYTRAI